MSSFFDNLQPLQFNPDSKELAFRHYNPDEMLMGKRMEDHLRLSLIHI